MGKGGSAAQPPIEKPTDWATARPKPVEALAPRDDFFWDEQAEPHATRRMQIIKAHPEVKKLYGHEWRSKYICIFLLVIPQIWLSWATQDLSWPAYLFVGYVFGATITQALFLAIHELAHNLFFKSSQANRYFAMVANWPIGIPYCVPFRGYHLEHHKYQGWDGIDTDIPSRLEGRLIRGPVTKTIWACCQILTYALRPMFIKAQDLTANHVNNWVSQIAFDVAIYMVWGYKPLLYFVMCIFLAGGLHPCAGHFISEHYVFPHLDAVQETYSYYGPLNWLTWNVGYHNEHHDFCNIPGSRLPALKKLAPEFYDNLAVCDSWIGVIWDYITRDEISPYNRVKREVPEALRDDAETKAAMSRAKVEVLYIVTALNPLLFVITNSYERTAVQVLKPYKAQPTLAAAYRTVFYFAKLKPRLLFTIGGLLRGLQLTTPIRFAFDPPAGCGAGINVLCLFAGSRWPATGVLGFALCKPFWRVLGAEAPSLQLPISVFGKSTRPGRW